MKISMTAEAHARAIIPFKTRIAKDHTTVTISHQPGAASTKKSKELLVCNSREPELVCKTLTDFARLIKTWGLTMNETKKMELFSEILEDAALTSWENIVEAMDQEALDPEQPAPPANYSRFEDAVKRWTLHMFANNQDFEAQREYVMTAPKPYEMTNQGFLDRLQQIVQFMTKLPRDNAVNPIFKEREIKVFLQKKQPSHFIAEWDLANLDVDNMEPLEIARYFDKKRSNEQHKKDLNREEAQKIAGIRRSDKYKRNNHANNEGESSNKRQKTDKNMCSLHGGTHPWSKCFAKARNKEGYDKERADKLHSKIAANKARKNNFANKKANNDDAHMLAEVTDTFTDKVVVNEESKSDPMSESVDVEVVWRDVDIAVETN
jgi:hypothetical protein